MSIYYALYTLENRTMMDGMGGGMMWGMGLIWIVVIVVLVLVAAALAKYLFSRR